jgi:hypothetical protein
MFRINFSISEIKFELAALLIYLLTLCSCDVSDFFEAEFQQNDNEKEIHRNKEVGHKTYL